MTPDDVFESVVRKFVGQGLIPSPTLRQPAPGVLGCWDAIKVGGEMGMVGMDHLKGNFSPLMVDRSLGQMRSVGIRYASIPQPVFEEWANWCSENASRLSWRTTCIGLVESPRGDVMVTDDDGNVLLCLMEKEHEGPHGYAHLLLTEEGHT
jgi:hypothetical protein